MLPSLASFVTLRAWRQRRGARTTRFCVRTSAVRPRETIARVAAASIASRLACRDDREAPLLSRRDADTILLIYVKRKAEYFFPKGWTAFLKNCPTGKSPGVPAASFSSTPREKAQRGRRHLHHADGRRGRVAASLFLEPASNMVKPQRACCSVSKLPIVLHKRFCSVRNTVNHSRTFSLPPIAKRPHFVGDEFLNHHFLV